MNRDYETGEVEWRILICITCKRAYQSLADEWTQCPFCGGDGC